MKNNFKISILIVGIILNGCHDGESPNNHGKGNVQTESKESVVIKTDSDSVTDKELFSQEEVSESTIDKYIPFSPQKFDKMVNYIVEEGFISPQQGIPCDHQFTFSDSEGNRHAFMTIRRDSLNNPSMSGRVDQITAYAHYQGVKSQENYFGYVVTKTEIRPPHASFDWDETSIRQGVEEFIEKIEGDK